MSTVESDCPRIQPRFQNRRVLIIESDATTTNKLALKFRRLGMDKLTLATPDAQPITWVQDFEPELIVTCAKSAHHDGPSFVTSLRRSDLASRKAPTIMISSVATKEILAEARDAGVDEVIPQPFSDPHLVERIDHVLGKRRPWIEAMGYMGPDRRRFNSGNANGPPKRGTKRAAGHLSEVEQSVRILTSAIVRFDSDRPQAMRSMLAQMGTLVTNAKMLGDPHFTASVTQLISVLKSSNPTRASLLPVLNALVKFLKI